MESYEPNEHERPQLTHTETRQFLSVLEYCFFALSSFTLGLLPVVLVLVLFRVVGFVATPAPKGLLDSTRFSINFSRSTYMTMISCTALILWLNRQRLWAWVCKAYPCPRYCVESAVVALSLAILFVFWNQDVLVFIFGSAGILTFSIGFFYVFLPKTGHLPRIG